MSDPMLAELQVALDRALAVFKTMFGKVMSGRVTWANIQDELTEDEQKVFWTFLKVGSVDTLDEAVKR